MEAKKEQEKEEKRTKYRQSWESKREVERDTEIKVPMADVNMWVKNLNDKESEAYVNGTNDPQTTNGNMDQPKLNLNERRK